MEDIGEGNDHLPYERNTFSGGRSHVKHLHSIQRASTSLRHPPAYRKHSGDPEDLTSSPQRGEALYRFEVSALAAD